MDLTKIPLGNAPEEVNVVIEIPQGSSIKYEIEKTSGAVFVDRFIHAAMVYPFNYGFLPHTLSEDGDPLDVLLISPAVMPGCVVRSRPIGMLEMEDENGIDTKIIAVPAKAVDPSYADILDIKDIDKHTRHVIAHFFERYKDLEPGKWVKISGFLGRAKAMKAIEKSIKAGK